MSMDLDLFSFFLTCKQLLKNNSLLIFINQYFIPILNSKSIPKYILRISKLFTFLFGTILFLVSIYKRKCCFDTSKRVK